MVSKFYQLISITIYNQLQLFPKFSIGILMSQYYDYHDIIIYSLINKEFFIKKFSYQLTSISFCLLDCKTYNSVFIRVC